jgi:hypothetical protein
MYSVGNGTHKLLSQRIVSDQLYSGQRARRGAQRCRRCGLQRAERQQLSYLARQLTWIVLVPAGLIIVWLGRRLAPQAHSAGVVGVAAPAAA